MVFPNKHGIWSKICPSKTRHPVTIVCRRMAGPGGDVPTNTNGCMVYVFGCIVDGVGLIVVGVLMVNE